MKWIHGLCLVILVGCADPMPVRAQYVPDTERRPCPAQDTGPKKKRASPKTRVAKKAQTTAKVNVNEATAEELEALPGIGPALAKRIVAYRTKRPFRRVSHIKRVRGIGPSIYGRLKGRIEVRSEPRESAPAKGGPRASGT